MIPVALAPQRLILGVAGPRAAAARRVQMLREGGATSIRRFCTETLPAHSVPATLSPLDLLWIVGLPVGSAAALIAAAHQAGALVNVEDQPALCDFHNVAELRRGDLLLTVSTAGNSPGLAARIRDRLGASFGPEWAGRLAGISADRHRWRAAGLPIPELKRRTAAAVEAAGWLR
ncbi:MAG TPA: siroheme synthase [Acetobacteraceae bacterium]|nr:siroheme synthase [Acetobacteraceae bacterium]